MRKIKFRGKDIGSNEWVYGHYTEGGWIDPTDGEVVKRYIIHGEDGFLHDIDPETLGEFTSLYDKNHKEIYEGDILEADGCSLYQKLEVRFVRGVFAFLWDGNLDDEFPTCSPTHEWAKVIGNIYDNPELIKEDD